MVDSPVNKFVYGEQDDPALRQELVSIAKGTGVKGTGVNPNGFACRPEQQEMIAFFDNPNNISAIKAAKAKYGMPAKNREATRSGWGKWTDYCDWYGIFDFYYYASLTNEYPILNPEEKTNCYSIKNYLDGLLLEQTNIEKIYTISEDKEKLTRQLNIIQEKFSEYNSLYAKMMCDEYFVQQEELKYKLSKEEQIKMSDEAQQKAFKDTAGTSGGGTKLAIYVFGGVAALIGIMLLARKNS